MATEILMPALSPTMEEGTLAKWLVKEGDAVKSGDILAEIETDKATMEFEAVDEGTVGRLLVSEGTQGVKVNTPIAMMLAEGESADAAPQGDSGSTVPYAAVVKSVQKTNRCVTVEEGFPVSSIGNHISAHLMENAFDWLDAPVINCTGKDVPMPYAANLEKLALITAAEVVEAVRKVTYR